MPKCARPPTRSGTEVGLMMKDVGLLGDRVRKLQNHLNQHQWRYRRHP